MSEFMTIVPTEWTNMWTVDMLSEVNIDIIALQQAEQFGILDDINEKLRNAAWLPEGVEGITGVKLIDNDELFVKFI